MRAILDAHKHIRVFVSHAKEDNKEARRYQDVIAKAGFSVFQYGESLRVGKQLDEIAHEIEKCYFFLFIVSDYSEKSEWVQRELGLALETQRRRGGYMPAIIPIYAKDSVWRRTNLLPASFRTRDFKTGAEGQSFDLHAVRVLDRYGNRETDSDALLISQMKPMLWTSRKDFFDRKIFDETGVFLLYGQLFPPSEQDDPEDIVRWVLGTDIGEKKSVKLQNGDTLEYRLDSRYFIVTIADRAIALAFFTYDYNTALVYGNYIGIHECWRPTDLAGTLFDKIVETLSEIFPKFRGIVFEVEKLDRKRLEHVVNDVKESPGDKRAKLNENLGEIRKVLRILWYQQKECHFFLDQDSLQPITCRSPCLAPDSADWEGGEEDYWLMWYRRPGSTLDIGAAGDLFRESVEGVYLECLAKSLVDAYPQVSTRYWRYANEVVGRTLKVERRVVFGRYMYRNDRVIKDLVNLLFKLQHNISI